MPSVPAAADRAGLVIDRETHTIKFTREFDAPAADIFEAWTKPEHVACWWDAAKQPLAVCEIDLKLQGSFKFVTRGHPDMPFAGTYREISPPNRLVFDALGSLGRVSLHETSGKTRMTVEIQCQSAEQLDQFIKMGVDVGTAQTLDNLVAYAGARAAEVC